MNDKEKILNYIKSRKNKKFYVKDEEITTGLTLILKCEVYKNEKINYKHKINSDNTISYYSESCLCMLNPSELIESIYEVFNDKEPICSLKISSEDILTEIFNLK